MSALLAALLAKALPFLLAAAGGLAALWTAFARGKSAERAKQAQARLETITEAQKIDDAIAGRTDAENRKEASKWVR